MWLHFATPTTDLHGNVRDRFSIMGLNTDLPGPVDDCMSPLSCASEPVAKVTFREGLEPLVAAADLS